MVLVILFFIILALIFKDVILKMFASNKVKILDNKGIICEEYKVEASSKKNIHIDVLDTDVKILLDNHAQNITISTKFLSQDFSYDVNNSGNFIKILRNNVQYYKKPGNSGKILIKLPRKCDLDKIDILVTNGDIEIYGVNSQKLVVRSDNGALKIDSLLSENLDIFKLHGDVYLSHVDCSNLRLNIKDGNGDLIDVYGEDIYVNVVNGDFIFANVCKTEYYINSLRVKTLNGRQRLNVNANLLGD